MSGDSVKLLPDARARVDTYLDAIEKTLERAGRPRDERRGVADDVEAQILEMLADRAGFAPTVADVEAVLSDLDPPEAYAEGECAASDGVPAGGDGAREAGAGRSARPPAPRGRRLSRAAIVGVCCAPAVTLLIPPVVVLVLPALSYTEPWGIPWVGVLVLAPLGLIGLSAPFGTTILGLVAVSHIRHSGGRLYGMGLAVFDTLLFPLLLLDGPLLFLVMTWADVEMSPGIFLVFIALVFIADVAVVVLVWRLLQRRARPVGTIA